MRCVTRWCCAIGLVLVGRTSHAADPPAASPWKPALEYVDRALSEGCPDEAFFRADVAKRLAYPPFADEAPTVLTVLLERTPRGFRATLGWRTDAREETGVQELTAGPDECEPLVRTVAFAASLAIQRRARQARASAPPPPLPRPTPPSPFATRATRATRGGSSPTIAVVWFSHAALLGSVGTLPRAALGVELGAGARFRALQLVANAELWSPTDTNDRDHAVASVTQRALGLRACASQAWFFGCAGIHGGFIVSQGREVTSPRPVTTEYLAVSLRAGGAFPLRGFLSPFTLGLFVEGRSPLLLTQVISGTDVLWQSPILGGLLGFSLATTIP